MSYADPEIVQTRLGSLYKDTEGPGEITDDMITVAVNDADTIIKSELMDSGLTPPDDTSEGIDDLHTAANLLTLADLLDTAYEGTDGERSATAKTKENTAFKLISKYINRPSTDEDIRAPRMRSFVAGNYDPSLDLVDEDDEDED